MPEKEEALFTPEELGRGVDAYFAQCEAEGVFPDWAGLKLFLGVFDDLCYEQLQQGDSREAAACREILAKAAARRESWLIRKMTSDNKAVQGCLNALKQPLNGGYSDRPREGGEIRLTINLSGVGGEEAFK